METPADFLSRLGYAGLFAVILAEEAGVPLPLPGDLFIAAMGFLAHSHRAAFLPTAAAVTGATVIGATILYALARHAGRPLLLRVARRFGYTAAREARLERWLERHGALAVVVGRLVPGLRIVMTVVAGALRLRHATFLAGTFVAGIVWATIYFWLGWALGASYARLAGAVRLEDLWPWAAGAVLSLAAFVLAWRARARHRARATDALPPAAAP